MHTTFNRDQVLRLTRETLDNTLRFFNTVNENLRRLVETGHDVNVPLMNQDEITRICTDFHRDHETRMHQITTICQDFTHTVTHHVPTNLTNIFDTAEVIRLNREVIDNTMRFFTTTNEALINGKMPQHDHVLPKNVIETINRAILDLQKTQIDFTKTFEHTFQRVLETITPTTGKTVHADHKVTNTTHPVCDEIFTLNRNLIDNTVHFFMNINHHVVAILENSDRKNIEHHADLINQVRNEYLNNHKNMIERLATLVRQTAENLTNARLETGHIANITNLFDHQEVLRINQEAIATTIKYFTTVTENLIHPRHENIETLVRETRDFQKHHQILTGRIETIWTDALNHVFESFKTHNLHHHTNENTVDNNREAVHGHETRVETPDHRTHDNVETPKKKRTTTTKR